MEYIQWLDSLSTQVESFKSKSYYEEIQIMHEAETLMESFQWRDISWELMTIQQ